MSDAEPPPAMEEATPTTPDVVLGEGYKDVEAIEGQKDDGACYGEGAKVDEGAEPCGDDAVVGEFVGIAEDPNQPAVAKVDEPDEGANIEGQTNGVTAAVDVLKEVGAAVASSTVVDDPMEVGIQTSEVTAAEDDLLEAGAALVSSSSADDPVLLVASMVNDDCNIVSTGGVHRLDDQTDQEVDGDFLDADEAAPLVNDLQDGNARMYRDVVANDDAMHAQDQENPQLDAATALLNEVETELVEAGDHVVQEGANMDTQVQTGDENEAEGVGTFADTATDEEGKLVGEITMTGEDSEKYDGAIGIDVSDEGIQMGSGRMTGDDNEQKEFATADEDHVEEKGMQMGAGNIAGDMDEEGKIASEYIAVEAVNGEAGIDVPEEKALQIDKAGNDIPEEEGAQMGGVGLIGNDNGTKEAVTADHDAVEENAILMNAAATSNDDDEDSKFFGKYVAEAVNDTTGDDVPEEEAAHMDDNDDDEPPPLVAKKGGGRRKRGRPSSKVQTVVKPSVKRKDEEEVCFICFDGGDLVICDRRFVSHGLSYFFIPRYGRSTCYNFVLIMSSFMCPHFRGCPKAYHPSCVNRDDDFFKSKGRWNCGMCDSFV